MTSTRKGILTLMGCRKPRAPVSVFCLSVVVGGRSFRTCGSSHFSSSSASSSGVGGGTSTTTSSGGDSAPPPPAKNEASLTSGNQGEEDAIGGEKSSISKAMHAYLKRAKENQELMTRLEKEFVFGRRHLANMMGKDVETFTQKDIDEAIRYLFPSGLYEPKARPIMRPPVEVYPKQKAAQFDMSGRPHHPFFYTFRPHYYYLLHEMVGKLNSLNKQASSVSGSNLSDDSTLAGSVWLSKEELETRLIEKITDQMYAEWVTCFERLASHPKRDRELDFINSYRKPLAKQTKTEGLPPVTLEPDGRKSVHVPLCRKKSARADVLVTMPGTGKFVINGQGLEYFYHMQSREAVIAPLQLAGMLGKVDVEANCEGGTLDTHHFDIVISPGETSRAISVRHGIAIALVALGVDAEKIRLAGYLTEDRRSKERKKPGRDGARAKWTWKKR